MSGEVHVVVLSFSGPKSSARPLPHRRAVLKPAMYDLDSGPILGTRPLTEHETPCDLAEYVRTVVSDMNSLSSALVMTYAKEWITKRDTPCVDTFFSAERREPNVSDLYAHILIGLADKPRELVSNMLTALLVGNIESTAADPDFLKTYQQWEALVLGDDRPCSS